MIASLALHSTAQDSMSRAVAELRRGHMVVLTSETSSAREGDLLLPARNATAENVAFMVRHGSGFVCAAMPAEQCDRLRLPPIYHTNQKKRQTAFGVSVDARHGITTGISARDRASTLRPLGDASTRPDQFTRPGHVVTLRGVRGGVLERAGRTEAAIDLCRLADAGVCAVLTRITGDSDTVAMPRGAELRAFAALHGLALVTVEALVAHREILQLRLEGGTPARLPTSSATFEAVEYRSHREGLEHVALVLGSPRAGDPVLVGIHTECLRGDVFGSLRCDCNARLCASLAAISDAGAGVLVYLSGQDYHMAACILHDLRVPSVQLFDGAVWCHRALTRCGIAVVDAGPSALKAPRDSHIA